MCVRACVRACVLGRGRRRYDTALAIAEADGGKFRNTANPTDYFEKSLLPFMETIIRSVCDLCMKSSGTRAIHAAAKRERRVLLFEN